MENNIQNIGSRFKQLIDKLGREKVDSIAQRVLSMELSGPTIEEYFALVEQNYKCVFLNNYTGISSQVDDIQEINNINKYFHNPCQHESEMSFSVQSEWIEEFEEANAI